MKISDLIKGLQEAKKELGDIPVLLSGDEEGNYYIGLSNTDQLHIDILGESTDNASLILIPAGQRISPEDY